MGGIPRLATELTFIEKLPDGTLNYKLTLTDSEHLEQPITLALSLFNGVPVLCERWTDSIQSDGEHWFKKMQQRET